MPRWRWQEIQDTSRLRDVINGIKRYFAAGIEIPEQWIDEYHLLLRAMERHEFY